MGVKMYYSITVFKNDSVFEINELILETFKAEEDTYFFI